MNIILIISLIIITSLLGIITNWYADTDMAKCNDYQGAWYDWVVGYVVGCALVVALMGVAPQVAPAIALSGVVTGLFAGLFVGGAGWVFGSGYCKNKITQKKGAEGECDKPTYGQDDSVRPGKCTKSCEYDTDACTHLILPDQEVGELSYFTFWISCTILWVIYIGLVLNMYLSM